jgi:hypothetical protein
MLLFDEEKHIYTVNNKVVPSVTQIFSCIGIRRDEESPWLSVGGSEFMKDKTAALYGTEFHKIPPYFLLKQKCIYDKAFEPDVISLKLFLEKHKITAGLIEQHFYSKIYGYAGTVDLYGHIQFERPRISLPIIIDWSTSTGSIELKRLQTAAYGQLIKENLELRRIPHRWTVRFRQDGKMPEIDKRHNHPQDWNRFLSLLNVYKTYSKEK